MAQTETSNLYNDAAALNTVFSNNITNGGTVASIKAALPTPLQKFFTPPGLYGPQNNFHIYEIYKWNLEVQKSFFGGATSISVNYLGNHGIHKPYTNAGLNAYSTTIAGPSDSGTRLARFSTGELHRFRWHVKLQRFDYDLHAAVPWRQPLHGRLYLREVDGYHHDRTQLHYNVQHLNHRHTIVTQSKYQPSRASMRPLLRTYAIT